MSSPNNYSSEAIKEGLLNANNNKNGQNAEQDIEPQRKRSPRKKKRRTSLMLQEAIDRD